MKALVLRGRAAIAIVAFVVLAAAAAFGAAPPALWVRSTTQASGDTWFGDVVFDAAGNAYVPGVIRSAEVVAFGNGVTAQDPKPDSWNAVLVKYDASGVPQWARAVTGTPTDSEFREAAIDSAGNVYVVGYIGKGTYDFGNGVVAIGVHLYEQRAGNVILVKYNAAGTAQWARTTVACKDVSAYLSVAVDASGNVYCAGPIGRRSFDFGDGVTATAGPDTDGGVVVVKYDSAGAVKWANAVPTGTGTRWQTFFNSVAVDLAGNVYIAGGIGNASYDFGNGIKAKLPAGSLGPVLLKYDPEGRAQWARVAAFCTPFDAVAVSPSGSVYAIGGIMSNYTAQFGNGVSLRVPGTGEQVYNMLLVKYDAAGAAQWARSVTQASCGSSLDAVATDEVGNVYVAGSISRTDTFGFGNGVTANGSYYGNDIGYGHIGENALLVMYDAGGTPQWAHSVYSSASDTRFCGLGIDPAGHVFATGEIDGGTVGYGPGVTVSAAGAWVNGVLVKY